jgi:uncharacterized protein
MLDTENKKFYSWNEFERDIKESIDKISPYRTRIKNVYGIPRGGLIIAVALSHYLEVPLILDSLEIGNGTLVCDDIADSGSTFVALENQIRLKRNEQNFELLSFAIHYNNKSKHKPVIWLKKKTNWIVYPWETINSSKYDGTKI